MTAEIEVCAYSRFGTEIDRALLYSYKYQIERVREDYDRLQPEELLFYPILDPTFIDVLSELRNGGISIEIIEVVSYLEGEATGIKVPQMESLSPSELYPWGEHMIAALDSFVVVYKNGEVAYKFDDQKGFAVPTELKLYGPRYPDGFPTVTVDYDIKKELYFDYDPNLESRHGWLNVKQ